MPSLIISLNQPEHFLDGSYDFGKIQKKDRRGSGKIRNFPNGSVSPETSGIQTVAFKRERKDMNNPRDIQRAYSEWFEKLITEKVGEDPRIEKATYFVTVIFEREGDWSRRRQTAGQRELDAFHEIYNRVCRKLIGRNFHRESHRDLLPTAIPFVDAEGSRFWGSFGDLTGLHIHSIWVVSNDKAIEFEQLLSSREAGTTVLLDRLRVDAIDVQRIEWNDRAAISTVTSYSSKMMGFNNRELQVGEDFRVYPLRCRDARSTSQGVGHMM